MATICGALVAARRSFATARASVAMGLVFSITFIGLLVGSLFYGWLGDRLGRRFTIILGTCNFGIPCSDRLGNQRPELAILRFIAGIGWARRAYRVHPGQRYAPRRLRSTSGSHQRGHSLGGVARGLVAAAVIRHTVGSRCCHRRLRIARHGAVLAIWLPNHALLSDNRPASAKLRRLVERLIPNEPVPANAVFVPATHRNAEQARRGTFSQLFSGPRAPATIFLWLLFICDALGFFFLASWLPVVMERQGISPAVASLTQSLFTSPA